MKQVPLKASLAILSIKVSRRLLRLLGRGGTSLPGKIGMKICPDVLSYAASDMETIIVTGTNGKTSTANMIEDALTKSGKSVLANKSGANLLSGVTSEFCSSVSLKAIPSKKYAVIECDEGALKHVVPLVKPKVIVVTNLFRDQLDRYGEIMNVLEAIKQAVCKVPGTTLVINADESLTASLSTFVDNPVIFYGINTPVGDQSPRLFSDASHCVKCKTEYKYNFYTYAHLGDFYCPACGYKRPKPDIFVTGIDEATPDYSVVTMNIKGQTRKVKIALPATFNIYNATAAVSAITAFGEKPDQIIETLGSIHSAFGRMETFDVNGKKARMILIKNPAGANQTIEYLSTINEDFLLVTALNDQLADGTDTSWIWDVEYEKLSAIPHVRHIIVTGDKRADLSVRLKYAGFTNIEIQEDYKKVVDKVFESTLPVFLIPNYTTMLILRDILKKRTGGKDIWEKQ